jgi:surface polysaccharide O-acyltransferase-like enzyme
MNTETSSRRFDLDWLRVVAIGAIFIYHTTRFFTAEGWFVHNAVSYPWLEDIAELPKLFAMPLIFVVSGMSLFLGSVRLARPRHTQPGSGAARAWRTIADKILRLGIPYALAVFTHSAWQVYLERITNGEFQGSFWEFYPHYFDGLYMFGGNFAWMGLHLWYVMTLLLFTVLVLPVLAALQTSRGRRVLAWLANLLARPGLVFLLAIPLWLTKLLFSPDSPVSMDLGGHGLLAYLGFLLSGLVLASSENLTLAMRKQRWISLAGGVGTAILILLKWIVWGESAYGTMGYAAGTALRALCSWFWLIAILGFAGKHLNHGGRLLQTANEAVLPFYIIHQPVMITIGYFTMSWPVPDLAKYLVTAAMSLAASLLLYVVLVRRFTPMRVLFVMKPLPRRAPALASPLAHRPAADLGRN